MKGKEGESKKTRQVMSIYSPKKNLPALASISRYERYEYRCEESNMFAQWLWCSAARPGMKRVLEGGRGGGGRTQRWLVRENSTGIQ